MGREFNKKEIASVKQATSQIKYLFPIIILSGSLVLVNYASDPQEGKMFVILKTI